MIPLLQRNILLKLQIQTFRRKRKYMRRNRSERENFFRPKIGAIRVLRFNLYLGELRPEDVTNGRDHSTVGGG
jgi:hypothetical protein